MEGKGQVFRKKGESGMFRILIVEDNNFFRELLKDTLLSQFPSLDIFEAADGKEAIQKVKTLLPDLIFMDIRLGEESGLKIIQKIKAKYPNIIIAILTGYDLPEYREAARQYEVDHFLTKGISTQEDIIGWLESILSARNLRMGS